MQQLPCGSQPENNLETSCPKCESKNIYQDMNIWICPECSHEWTEKDGTQVLENEIRNDFVKDAYGNILSDGDSVIVIKDLKVNRSSNTIKSGTKVRNIRLADAGDGHDIACKIDGVGSINLKSAFVKKV